MLSGHGSASRRRRNSRAARIAVPLAIPMALGLTLGIVLAVSGGDNATTIEQSALGSCASAAASASGAAPAASASADGAGAPAPAASAPADGASAPAPAASAPAPAASAPASAAASAAPAPCPSGSASASASAPAVQAAADNTNCDIIVPANPLSAQGLATPYQLTGPNGTSAADSGCTMANAGALGAFVQATILNPRTGKLAVYNPLVITQGTTPAAAPVVPRLPRRAIVTIDFGFNGNTLTQVGATPDALRQGRCVNGLGSPFGQQSFCNGKAFFRAAHALMAFGRLRVPSQGTSAKIVPTGGRLGTGRACPNVRNFDMIDQDQSDNVTSTYLLNQAGQTAQDTAANEAGMNGAQALSNGSDNALVDKFLDPALGCTPFMAPDLANNNTLTTSQALDELLAAAPRNTPRIPALVPENDPMVLDAGGNLDPAKTNLYRAEVGQPAINRQNDRWDSPANYCQNMINIQAPFLAANQAVFAGGPSPVADVGNNLYTFLANRLLQSFDNLGCKNFGLTNPVQVVTDGNGAATSATINTTRQHATGNGANGGGGNGGGGNGGGGQGNGGQGDQQSWQRIWHRWHSRGGQDGQQDGGM
jgi:hypothetical protein